MANLLIVDDNRMYRRTMKRIISRHLSHIPIYEAANGAEAIRKIRERKPDLILMDIHLPGENGLKITEKIKAENPDTPIIFITAYDSQEYRDAASQLGAEAFLSKNQASTEEIVSTIASALRRG